MKTRYLLTNLASIRSKITSRPANALAACAELCRKHLPAHYSDALQFITQWNDVDLLIRLNVIGIQNRAKEKHEIVSRFLRFLWG